MRSSATRKPEPSAPRETDFHAWLFDQAALLRHRQPELIDWEGVAEELDAMAKSLERALESYLEVLLTHLLKWRYEAKRQSVSWEVSIENARSDVRNLLEDSPSLATKRELLLARAYEKARRSAGADMALDKRAQARKFPPSCPWKFETIVGDFWPDPANGANGHHQRRR